MKRNAPFAALLKRFTRTQKPQNPTAYADRNPDFEVIALGMRSGSGITDGNPSAYLVRPLGLEENAAVMCDAGTLGHGLQQAEESGALDAIPTQADCTLSRPGQVLHQTIRAYLISHALLDHVAGLVLTSPDDTPKPIFALPETNTLLSEHLFNNRIWSNQANRGNAPALGKYHYRDMTPGRTASVPDTGIAVTAWPLTHGESVSTAFLITANGKDILYLGDTQADDSSDKKVQCLHALWKAIIPSVREKRLKAIVMEVSKGDHPENALSGHMTPAHLLQSMRDLALECGGRHHIRGLKIIVTHMKESFATGEDPVRQIARGLNDGNDMGLCFIMARQGERYLV